MRAASRCTLKIHVAQPVAAAPAPVALLLSTYSDGMSSNNRRYRAGRRLAGRSAPRRARQLDVALRLAAKLLERRDVEPAALGRRENVEIRRAGHGSLVAFVRCRRQGLAQHRTVCRAGCAQSRRFLRRATRDPRGSSARAPRPPFAADRRTASWSCRVAPPATAHSPGCRRRDRHAAGRSSVSSSARASPRRIGLLRAAVEQPHRIGAFGRMTVAWADCVGEARREVRRARYRPARAKCRVSSSCGRQPMRICDDPLGVSTAGCPRSATSSFHR